MGGCSSTSNSLLKKAHLLRCARSARSKVLPKYASARGFFARLAPGTFLISLRRGFFSTLLKLRADAMRRFGLWPFDSSLGRAEDRGPGRQVVLCGRRSAGLTTKPHGRVGRRRIF